MNESGSGVSVLVAVCGGVCVTCEVGVDVVGVHDVLDVAGGGCVACSSGTCS